MLPACAKTEVWKTLIDDLSNRLHVPIICGQAIFGKLPFFQELRNRQNDTPYANVPGIHYETILIADSPIIVGPFRTSEPHALDEELSEARTKLPEWQEHYHDLITHAINSAAIAGKLAAIQHDSLARAKLLLEFNKAIAHAKDTDHALTSAVQFIVSKFKLGNAFISAYGKHARYFDLTEPAKQVEARVIAHLRGTKSTCTIQNIQTDFLLQDIKDKEKLPKCIIGLPLEHNREIIGHALFTAEFLPPLEGLSEVLYELVSVLSRLADYEKAQTSAVTDPLTGLHNRAELTQKIDALITDLSRKNQPISILMIDADNFKKFNDTNGHPEGDKVLRIIAEIMKALTPKTATCARYGGEEFMIVLPQTTPQSAKEFAETLRQEIEKICPLTISLGLITCMNSSASRETMIREADEALYRAKHLGKNKVIARLMLDKTLGIIDA